MKRVIVAVLLIALLGCGKRTKRENYQDVILTEDVDVIFTDINNKYVARQELPKVTNSTLAYEGKLYDRKAVIKEGYLKGEVSVSTILNRVYTTSQTIMIYKEQL